jgi:AraC-like DNA-binding protein
LTEGLLEADSEIGCPSTFTRVDVAAIARARQLLDAETSRVVRSNELETVSGLTRFDLARQFRALVGASPYRYSVMRRLEVARSQIGRQAPLVDAALNAGFADQAHFTRMFTARYGITPGHYRELRSRGG